VSRTENTRKLFFTGQLAASSVLYAPAHYPADSGGAEWQWQLRHREHEAGLIKRNAYKAMAAARNLAVTLQMETDWRLAAKLYAT
jgi:hypothetical protein